MTRIFKALLRLTGYLFVVSTLSGHLYAQSIGVAPSELQADRTTNCSQIRKDFSGKENGKQWLVKDEVQLFELSNSRESFLQLEEVYNSVTCYSKIRFQGKDRVFVRANDDSFCGWVNQDDLLAVNKLGDKTFGAVDGRDLVCETPRATTLKDFCADGLVNKERHNVDCTGVPQGLRAKGILIGSTQEESGSKYEFYSSPDSGDILGARFFFSILEIHEVARGTDDNIMVLVGDGEGDLFGWINLEAVQLWPTRLGLYYDETGLGRMFTRQGKMIVHHRTRGATVPDISPGVEALEVREYLHGGLPLLSYPIIRTIDTEANPAIDSDISDYHEVIFLGRTGEGSASQLLREAELARDIQEIQQLNVLLLTDTTESMVPYLPQIRDGISNFIEEYRTRINAGVERLPKMRISVYGYSDFSSADSIRMDSPIDYQQIVPPLRIDPGYSISRSLDAIKTHPGLFDNAGGTGDCGPYSEAAFEAIARLAPTFASDEGWFPKGPRIIIHMADHGSRETINLREISKVLNRENVYYFPVAVTTDDEGISGKTCAREMFVNQASRLFAPFTRGDRSEVLLQEIDFRDGQEVGSAVVQEQLNLALAEVVQAVSNLRSGVIGQTLVDQKSLDAMDKLTSVITVDEKILEDRGLDPDDVSVILQANTAFAPFNLWNAGQETPIDWNYTVAFEPIQSTNLARKMEAMCSVVGKPEQFSLFRDLISDMAKVISGDQIETIDEFKSVLSDLKDLPGANKSLLADSPDQLLQRAKSTDPAVVADLKKDVCWISYHLTNMTSSLYARPDQLSWAGNSWRLKQGEEVIKRDYIYKPIVGGETAYIPDFFLVKPEFVTDSSAEEACDFFTCAD